MRTRKLVSPLLFILAIGLASPALALTKWQGFADMGSQSFVTTLTGSTLKGQRLCTTATLQVRNHGTVTGATIYSDEAGTMPIANGGPFAVNTDGSVTFYANDGTYDLLFSGCSTSWTRSGIVVGAGASGSPVIRVNSAPYNAVGDGKIVYDAVILVGALNTLTSISGRFLTSDVGKLIRIEGAGAAGVAHSTTIASVVGTGTITLTTPAITPVSGVETVWGTDNTPRFQATINAVRIGTANSGNATIVFGNSDGTQAMYLISDTVSSGTNMHGVTLTSYNYGYVNPDITGAGATYQNTNIRWAGPDGTGKAMFQIDAGANANTISNLGFTGGADTKAIWFRPQAVVSINANWVHNCQFWAKPYAAGTSIGILFGYDLSVTGSDADMGNNRVSRCVFFDPLQYGIAFNAANNGYVTTMEGNAFYMATYSAGQREIYAKAWNTLTIRDSIMSQTATRPFVDGAYAIEAAPAGNVVGGWLSIENVYGEVPLLLKVGSLSYPSLAAVSLKNVTINTSTTSASDAVTVTTGFVVAINVGLSSFKGVLQQRSLNAPSGGVYIGGVLDATGTVVRDSLLPSGKWISIGAGGPMSTGSLTTSAFTMPNNYWLSGYQTTNELRRIIGIDTANNIRIGSDGAGATILNIDTKAINVNTTVAGISAALTPNGGVASATILTAGVTANSTILISRRFTGGTVGNLSIGGLIPGTSFRIDSDNPLDTSTVSWMIVN